MTQTIKLVLILALLFVTIQSCGYSTEPLTPESLSSSIQGNWRWVYTDYTGDITWGRLTPATEGHTEHISLTNTKNAHLLYNDSTVFIGTYSIYSIPDLCGSSKGTMLTLAFTDSLQKVVHLTHFSDCSTTLENDTLMFNSCYNGGAYFYKSHFVRE